jgi:hypothetical protein
MNPNAFVKETASRLTLLFIIILIVAPAIQAADLPQIVKSIKPSIVGLDSYEKPCKGNKVWAGAGIAQRHDSTASQQ